MIGIDISALYKGIGVDTSKLIRYNIPTDSQKTAVLTYNIPNVEITKDEVYNYLNMPIIFPIVFKGGSFEIYNNGKLEQISLFDFRLPDTTICTFKASKQATETIINGGNTRIIELWSDLLWDIEIKGMIIPSPDNTTQEIIEQLITFSRIKNVRVIGDLFTWLKIDQLFIKDIDLQQNQGFGDIITFSLSAIETEPLELIL